MWYDSNSEIQCPICLGVLRKPVRNLLCGHAFCEECLVGLCKHSSSSLRCPECRQETNLGPQGVKSLSRNWIVENIIIKRKVLAMQTSAEKINKASTMTTEDLNELRDQASKYKNEKNFKAAIHILLIILDEVESYHKIKPMIDLLDCLLETNPQEVAEKVCKDVADVVNSLDLSLDAKMSCSSHDIELRRLAEAFMTIDYKTSILLNRCSYKFCKMFSVGKDKVVKLSNISIVMMKIAEEMKRNNKIADFNDQLPFMDEIVNEMQETLCGDLIFKCVEIAWCLIRIGILCIYTKSHDRSILIHMQAICLMKSVYGADAKKYMINGKCHHNMGVAYENTNQRREAKRAYLKAKEIYEYAEDWADNEVKKRSISVTNESLKRIS